MSSGIRLISEHLPDGTPHTDSKGVLNGMLFSGILCPAEFKERNSDQPWGGVKSLEALPNQNILSAVQTAIYPGTPENTEALGRIHEAMQQVQHAAIKPVETEARFRSYCGWHGGALPLHSVPLRHDPSNRPPAAAIYYGFGPRPYVIPPA